jgi:hypothetical protein
MSQVNGLFICRAAALAHKQDVLFQELGYPHFVLDFWLERKDDVS